jgi:mRNA-degrading endonuclease YafQ of YafQ-DinJ toxin-antitoxin module
MKGDLQLKKEFWEAMTLFGKEPFQPALKTHKLTGKLKGLWALTVSYDCRVIFTFLSRNEVVLIDIGSHDEVC